MNYKKIIYTFLSILLVLQVVSCNKEEYPHLKDGEGVLRFSFSHNHEESVIVRSNVSTEEPVFAVVVKNLQTGEVLRTTEDHREFAENPLALRKGKYVVEATNGTDVNAAFGQPFFSGKDTVEVIEGTSVTSMVTTTLSNVKASVFMRESIQNNFTDYVVVINNSDGGELLYEGESLSESGFFKCTGTLSWKINLVNNNGEAFDLFGKIRNVKPREHYKLYFNIDENGDKNTGGIGITISFDETTNMKEYLVDIPLDKGPEPTFEGVGFDISTAIMVKQNIAPLGSIKIHAEEGVKDIIISHASEVLFGLGLPKSIKLAGMASDQQTAINALGITWTDLKSKDVELNPMTFLSKLPLGSYSMTIEVIDSSAQFVCQDLEITLIPDVDVTTLRVDPWSKFAYMYAQWNTVEKPEVLGFKYRKAADASWNVALGKLIITDNKFFMKVQGLEPNTAYEFMAVTLENDSNIMEFTTEAGLPLPNASLDSWCQSGKILYPNVDIGSNFFWDSGNTGTTTLNYNATTQETKHVVKGSAARLGSMYAGIQIAGAFAAGSMYSGRFVKISGFGGELSFGRPFTSRPVQLKGHYDYSSGNINYAESGYGHLSGQKDSCHIYIMLTDWAGPFQANTNTKVFIKQSDPAIIAYGELKSNQNTGGYKEFVIDLAYRRENAKPTHIVVVATASKYGDYFTGSTSSVLYLDELELIY